MMLLAILLPALMIPVVLAVGRRGGVLVPWLAGLPVGVSFLMLVWIAISAGEQPRVPYEYSWVPSLGVQLEFLVDGLSLFFGLIIGGIGILVCWYAAQYLDGEKEKNHRFFAYLLFFVTAMLGTVFSDNLLVLFVFWELTGVASFLLIGYWHEGTESQLGARRALIVTVATGLCLLVGIVLLRLGGGTYSLRELTEMDWIQKGASPAWMTWAMVLVMLGVFGKSAQFPFHFWLPGAMAAPTPVSAYLHSATMVKLGVFLTARVFPVFQDQNLWLHLLAGVGFFTMLLGAFLALRSNDLKALLAYSTISQLGFLVGFYGVGSAIGVRLDFYHILSHVFYKAALFMTAGIVDHCTGVRDVRRLGGLGKLMPMTAITALIAAAALAGLPLTTGFISKEMLLADLMELRHAHPAWGSVLIALAVSAAVLTATVAARFFIKVFLGDKPQELHFHAPNLAIQLPPFLLAVAVIVFGTFPGLLQKPLESLTVSGLHTVNFPKLAFWHGFNVELAISLGVFVCAALVYLWAERTQWRWTYIPRWLNFDKAFDQALDELVIFARRLTHALQADWPPAYLPIVISAMLIIVGGISIRSLLSQDWEKITWVWQFRPMRMLVAVLITVAMIGIVFLRRWSSQLVSLSIAGFFITLYFVFYRAPDLAMTQILVESASVVMILLLLSRFPSSSQIGVRFEFGWEFRHLLRLVISGGVGIVMAGLVLYAEFHRHASPAGWEFLKLSQPLAGGTNAVNTILVDFRGFDTLGEITVLLIATLGSLGLMMRYKRQKGQVECSRPPGFFLGRKNSEP